MIVFLVFHSSITRGHRDRFNTNFYDDRVFDSPLRTSVERMRLGRVEFDPT